MTEPPAPSRRRAAQGCLSLLLRSPVTLAITAVTWFFFAVEYGMWGPDAGWFNGGSFDITTHIRLGAMRPDLVLERGEWYRLIMPMFLHAGPVHLILNWVAFLQLGVLVEHLYGRARLAGFYFLCGLVGSAASLYGLPDGVAGAVGASGAIMGLAGLMLGASWYAAEPWRGRLRKMFGRRLLFGVTLTFVLGISLNFFLPMVDNWAHFGGFATGMVLAAIYRDPDEMPGRFTGLWAGMAVTGWLAAASFMAVDGADALKSLDADLWRAFERRADAYEPGIRQAGMLSKMIEHCWAAEEQDLCMPRFEARLAEIDDTYAIELLVAYLFTIEPHEEAIGATAERWVALTPDNHAALNALAWHLATREGPRELDRAEALSRRSLDLLETEGASVFAEAAYQDTLAEILYQQGALDEALTHQQRAVRLAEAAELSDLPVLQARLAKIQAAHP